MGKFNDGNDKKVKKRLPKIQNNTDPKEEVKSIIPNSVQSYSEVDNKSKTLKPFEDRFKQAVKDNKADAKNLVYYTPTEKVLLEILIYHEKVDGGTNGKLSTFFRNALKTAVINNADFLNEVLNEEIEKREELARKTDKNSAKYKTEVEALKELL